MKMEDLRRNYENRPLEISDLRTDPIEQFTVWFEEALASNPADWFEPNAMTLATADGHHRVSARIVLLKQVSTQGFTFFTNYESAKAHQIEENPRSALAIFWPYLARQVRIEGSVTPTDEQTSDTYFRSRPRDSQIAALASHQSQPLESREELERRVQELQEQYADREIPRPPNWGGFLVRPDWMEFWQGRPSRLHDRFVYTLQPDNTWQIVRLAP